MKTVKQLKPNYAPVYAALYPDLAKVLQKNGYALAIHGSLKRDFDVVAIPWGKKLSEPKKVIGEIEKEFTIRQIGKPQEMNYGRTAYTLSIGHGACAIDLSFLSVPIKKKSI